MGILSFLGFGKDKNKEQAVGMDEVSKRNLEIAEKEGFGLMDVGCWGYSGPMIAKEAEDGTGDLLIVFGNAEGAAGRFAKSFNAAPESTKWSAFRRHKDGGGIAMGSFSLKDAIYVINRIPRMYSDIGTKVTHNGYFTTQKILEDGRGGFREEVYTPDEVVENVVGFIKTGHDKRVAEEKERDRWHKERVEEAKKDRAAHEAAQKEEDLRRFREAEAKEHAAREDIKVADAVVDARSSDDDDNSFGFGGV